MCGEYEGKYNIVWNDRDVEMDLYASLDYNGEVDEIKITNTHYVDSNEPINPEEIQKEVEKQLCNEEWEFWGYHEDGKYSGEMDCVDYWRYKHGMDV